MNDARLSAALRRITEEAVTPPIDPVREQELLSAFDAHLRSQRTPRVSHAAMAAGILAIAATIVFTVTRPPRTPAAPRLLDARSLAMPTAPLMLTEGWEPAPIRRSEPLAMPPAPPAFVMWPGANDLPRFESGQLMRVELPASVVLSLGLRPSRPLRNDGTVQTDVLVGQDGFARAVRLVQ